jgi:hypothetical protein
MKTRLFLAAMLFLLMGVSVYVQAQNTHDNPNTVVPGHPGIQNPSLGWFTTLDNENNAFTGTPDGDMDVYLYKSNPVCPIEFNIFVDDNPVTSAQLSILAFDVDWPQGEIDEVWFNGHDLGHLIGVNDTWSTSVFTIPAAWVIPGPAGKNLVQIYPDIATNGSWAVQVDWGQLILNGSTGAATFRYVTLDKAAYCGSQCVLATEEVDATPDMSVRVETSLLDPNGGSVAQDTRTFTATNGNEAFTASLCLPATPLVGTWHVQCIVYDAITNTQEDIKVLPIQVTVSCNSIPTLGQWGLIILGFVLLGFGTFYILKLRG